MYTISYPSGTIRKDGAVIEQDDRTPEFQAYIAWLKAGNGPVTLQDPPALPRIQVTSWQFIQALAHEGLLGTVDAAASGSDDMLIRLGWQRAPNFWSDDPLVLAMAAAIGLTREQLQQLFELAASF